MARNSNPLANFLISLADPRNLKAYQQNPDDYLERFGVSEADRTAIASASAEAIRQRAAGLGQVARRGRGQSPSRQTEIFEIAEISEIKEISEIAEVAEIKEISEIAEIKEISEIGEIGEIKEISEIAEI